MSLPQQKKDRVPRQTTTTPMVMSLPTQKKNQSAPQINNDIGQIDQR